MIHLLLLALMYAVHASYECREFSFFDWLKHPRWTWIEYVVPWCIVVAYLLAAAATASEIKLDQPPTWDVSLIQI